MVQNSNLNTCQDLNFLTMQKVDTVCLPSSNSSELKRRMLVKITTQHQRGCGHAPEGIPAFKLPTGICEVSDRPDVFVGSLYPKLQPLTVHTLCIDDVLCSFSYCEIQRFAANFVHSPGVQGPLLLGASKGFNARIQLCKKQTQLPRTG